MTSANAYKAQVEEILGSHFRFGRIQFKITSNSVEEAKQHLAEIRQMQKQLRLVKKDLNNTMKFIRSKYTARKSEVGLGFGAGLFAGFFGRKTAGKLNATRKEDLRREQWNALSPYEGVKRTIDELLINMDGAKVQLESYIEGEAGADD